MLRNYNATVAKIMAIYGKRVQPQDYTEMMNKQSVSEVAEYLKRNTHYSGLLSSIDTNTIHRGMLENLLRRSIFETYMRITGFEHISKQEFYNYKILQTEIDEILRCIRFINAKSQKLIADVPIYINDLTSFDLIELAKITDFNELLEFLKKTPYYDVLKNIRPSGDGLVDVTKCETLLRSYYIERLKASLRFKKRDVEQFTNLLDSDIDLINIINAYRLTAFFGEPETEIEKDMLPFYGRLSAVKQREIYSAPNSEEFIKKFSKTYYGKQMIENGYDINSLEQSAQRLRHKYAKLMLKRSASAPLSVYSFIFLLEIEVQNIISIIEGIRYGIEVNKIASLIIM
ncbi:MAG: V-type ATPase subunit [Ruminococcus sp.]|nr:V-type ATPase subunit [Ruminococcus sp.]MCM1382293.1 V-type ATPase subunit [Muribaculaceae bacterium]MCM1479984.1 V-type ATPase subunit [Muribaculaceae bacterium]